MTGHRPAAAMVVCQPGGQAVESMPIKESLDGIEAGARGYGGRARGHHYSACLYTFTTANFSDCQCLSMLGWTYREIGERLGIGKTQAQEDVSENSETGKIGQTLGGGESWH